MSLMTDFFNKVLLTSTIDDILDDYPHDAVFYIYNNVDEEFCPNDTTMKGISVFNRNSVRLYLEAHWNTLGQFIIFQPNSGGWPDMVNPVITGLEINQIMNTPQETGGFNALTLNGESL